MCNLYVAIDIEAAELRNRRSTCENYLRVWARDCEISYFSPRLPFIHHFFRPSISSLFTSFSRSPLFLAFRSAVNHSQFRCSIPVSPVRLVLFHPAIKKRKNERKFVRVAVNIVHGQRTLPRGCKSHGFTYLYECDANRYMSGVSDESRLERAPLFANDRLRTASSPVLIF